MIMSRAIGKFTYSPMTNEIVELLKDHEMVCIWVEDSPRAVVGREFGKAIGKSIGGDFGKTLGGNLGAALGRNILGTLFKFK